jgi:hypothetical protein
MARLPHAEQAIFDTRKLEEHCLNPAHLRGRHKARVFRAALGISQADAGWLQQICLKMSPTTKRPSMGRMNSVSTGVSMYR